MLMRHAEKPAKDDTPYGVTVTGKRSKESLEIRGWQRAGALTNLLTPANGRYQNGSVESPQFLYASKPLRRKGSRRPMETIMPLADKLKLTINSSFQRSDCKRMVEDAVSRKGVVLICWQREYIPEIAEEILGKKNIAPSEWPDDRFDMIWVFDLNGRSLKYKFKQVPQKLLARDRGTPIK